MTSPFTKVATSSLSSVSTNNEINSNDESNVMCSKMTALFTKVTPPTLPSLSETANNETTSSSESSSCGFHSLPDELLFKIFSDLTQDELLSPVSLVCRRWNNVSSDPRLYRTLVFHKTRPSTGDALQLIEKASQLTRIELNHRCDTDVLLSCLAQRLANNRLQNTGSLKTLVMTDCAGEPDSDISSTHLRNVMKHCTELSHLKIHLIHCSDSTVFQEIGTLLPSLTSLDLRRVKVDFTVKALQSITERPHTFPFTSLSIEEVRRNAKLCLAAFCNRFQETLTTFKVLNYSISNVDLTALLTCRKLTTLEFHTARCVNDEDLLALGAMPNIRTLTLARVYHVTTPCWISYFDSPHVRKIRRLTLIMCFGFNDNVASAIARNLRDLEDLTLHFCRYITSKGSLQVQQLVQASCNVTIKSEQYEHIKSAEGIANWNYPDSGYPVLKLVGAEQR